MNKANNCMHSDSKNFPMSLRIFVTGDVSLVTTLEVIEGGTLPAFDYQLHYCLTDNADWNDQCWDIRIPDLDSYSNALQDYFASSKVGINFQVV